MNEAEARAAYIYSALKKAFRGELTANFDKILIEAI